MMAIGVWEPEQKKGPPKSVDLAQLQRFIGVVREGRLEQFADALGRAEIADGAGLMKLDPSAWGVAEQLGSEDIELLIRFFTRAEILLPGWEGGKRSPVIWLVKILRARDAFTPDLRRWIKANTENRYLPYGSL